MNTLEDIISRQSIDAFHRSTADYLDGMIDVSRRSVREGGVNQPEATRQLAQMVLGDDDLITPPEFLAYALALAIRRLAAQSEAENPRLDPDRDDPMGTGWVISDEFYGDSDSNNPNFWDQTAVGHSAAASCPHRAECVCDCGHCHAGNCHLCSKNSFHAYSCRIECHGDQ